MRARPVVTTVLIGAILITASACTAQPSAAPAGGTVFPDEAVSDAIAQLPQESVAPVTAMRLAEGLIPPTNRWFSGLVFGDAPQPVFPLPLAFSLIIGGAIGNVVDRVVHGAVVDFLYFHIGRYGWPAFNVADSAITVGVALMLWAQFRAPRTTPTSENPS